MLISKNRSFANRCLPEWFAVYDTLIKRWITDTIGIVPQFELLPPKAQIGVRFSVPEDLFGRANRPANDFFALQQYASCSTQLNVESIATPCVSVVISGYAAYEDCQ